ncbi:FHA domain-containing protein, partial [Streptomyces vinaceus]|uniref:FHA domain-containing protein n=1 Tax=Streptomyces vinaceus TaxID=1960 RepID=UPI00368A0CBE
MQIRLTVLGSRSGHQTAPAGCDVLVTAPVGTALAAVASGLAATVGGPDTGGTVVLYAGTERLDLQRRVLGEPPLVDGAVLGLGAPVPGVLPDGDVLPVGADGAQLHVVAGPDAGGVHLLHPGAIRIGRSADADVPLDDPDVSRLHCAVTVMPDGRVAVADLNSTNGTTVDGAPVGAQPVALAPGALLRIGESTLRLASEAPAPLPLVPDLEGHLSLPAGPLPATPDAGATASAEASAAGWSGGPGPAAEPRGPFPHPAPSRNGGSAPDPQEHRSGPLPDSGTHGAGWSVAAAGVGSGTGLHIGAPGTGRAAAEHGAPGATGTTATPGAPGAPEGIGGAAQRPRKRGLGAWARKWVRGEEEPGYEGTASGAVTAAAPDADDPAALLLAALGPTRRLWSRPPGRLDAGLWAGSRIAFEEVGALGIA